MIMGRDDQDDQVREIPIQIDKYLTANERE